MLVMKFKGAVLQNQETLAEIKNRIKEQNCCSIVVVSALKGVMPRLRQLYGLSLRRGAGFENEFNELKQVHEQLAYELLAGRKLEEYKVELQKELNDLYGILHHVGVLRESSHCMKDYILAKGDILASLLFSKLFDQAEWHDSRNFMLTVLRKCCGKRVAGLPGRNSGGFGEWPLFRGIAGRPKQVTPSLWEE
mgnify:CR=1 FL=1